MGLLDGIIGSVVNSVLGSGQLQSVISAAASGLGGGSQAQAGGLVSAVLALLQQQGGMGAVLDQFRRNGMAQQADSWVSTGQNQAVSAEQVQQALGASSLGNIASQLGISQGQAGSALAQVLPELINQLTPQGRLPDNQMDVIGQVLSALRGRSA
jgi:uncharacterized protein YidB (DUF937 family)